MNKTNAYAIDSEEFAEFYGLLLGDGCIYSNLHGLCISSDSLLDRQHIEEYVAPLIYKIFKAKPRIYYSNQSRSIRCILYRKNVCKFLADFGFPVGKKSEGKPTIPFKNKKLIAACLRGLMDSDGSLYPHPNAKVIVDISVKIPALLHATVKAMEDLDLPFKYTHNRIYFAGKDKVKSFINTIGTSNPKHAIKYEIFHKRGYVPKTEETKIFLTTLSHFNLVTPYYGPVV